MAALPLTLFGTVEVELNDAVGTRVQLDECCWIDVARSYLHGAERLLGELETAMSWHRGRRLMYGVWHDEPRLSASAANDGLTLPSIIEDIRADLTRRYQRSFEGLFCNYYLIGADSVAWHADRIGRTEIDPLVAIVGLGGPRTFALRPFGGGRSLRIGVHSGDLVVMGGATQHHWEHAVPKVRHAAPRMSVTMRAGGPVLVS